MYRLVVKADRLDDSRASVQVEVATAPGARPLGAAKVDDRDAGRAGSSASTSACAAGGGIEDRITAAEAARDSVEETVQFVERRLESMRAAHTATTRFADLTRDGLRELSNAITGDPPPIPSSVDIVGIEPLTPPEPLWSTSLEELEGIGPKRADTLRTAGIPDVETLVRTKPDRLVAILGRERTKDTLDAAERLLRRRGASRSAQHRPPAVLDRHPELVDHVEDVASQLVRVGAAAGEEVVVELVEPRLRVLVPDRVALERRSVPAGPSTSLRRELVHGKTGLLGQPRGPSEAGCR